MQNQQSNTVFSGFSRFFKERLSAVTYFHKNGNAKSLRLAHLAHREIDKLLKLKNKPNAEEEIICHEKLKLFLSVERGETYYKKLMESLKSERMRLEREDRYTEFVCHAISDAYPGMAEDKVEELIQIKIKEECKSYQDATVEHTYNSTELLQLEGLVNSMWLYLMMTAEEKELRALLINKTEKELAEFKRIAQEENEAARDESVQVQAFFADFEAMQHSATTTIKRCSIVKNQRVNSFHARTLASQTLEVALLDEHGNNLLDKALELDDAHLITDILVYAQYSAVLEELLQNTYNKIIHTNNVIATQQRMQQLAKHCFLFSTKFAQNPLKQEGESPPTLMNNLVNTAMLEQQVCLDSARQVFGGTLNYLEKRKKNYADNKSDLMNGFIQAYARGALSVEDLMTELNVQRKPPAEETRVMLGTRVGLFRFFVRTSKTAKQLKKDLQHNADQLRKYGDSNTG